jgi:hypothetical protein
MLVSRLDGKPQPHRLGDSNQRIAVFKDDWLPAIATLHSGMRKAWQRSCSPVVPMVKITTIEARGLV